MNRKKMSPASRRRLTYQDMPQPMKALAESFHHRLLMANLRDLLDEESWAIRGYNTADQGVSHFALRHDEIHAAILATRHLVKPWRKARFIHAKSLARSKGR